MAPHSILEISMGVARDMANVIDKYENLKPFLKTSEFCKATDEVNLVDYQKQKSELDSIVADFKKTKSTADELERHIEGRQKQLAILRKREKKAWSWTGYEDKGHFPCAGSSLSFKTCTRDC